MATPAAPQLSHLFEGSPHTALIFLLTPSPRPIPCFPLPLTPSLCRSAASYARLLSPAAQGNIVAFDAACTALQVRRCDALPPAVPAIRHVALQGGGSVHEDWLQQVENKSGGCQVTAPRAAAAPRGAAPSFKTHDFVCFLLGDAA